MERADTVELTIPARIDFVRLTRLVASGLATQAEFTVDEIEDVRIAVDEICTALIDRSSPDRDLAVRFFLRDATLECEVTAEVGEPTVLDELSIHILDATVDHHQFEHVGDRTIARLRKARASVMP